VVRPVAAASAADPDREGVDPAVDPVEPLPPEPPGLDPPGAEPDKPVAPPVPDPPPAGTPITGTVKEEVGVVSAGRTVGSAFESSTFVGTGLGGVVEATGVGVTVGVELAVGFGV
jgi:hypothetical protein